MNLLLDTHAFLWFSEDNQRLTQNAKSLSEDSGNNCFISMASIWEMAIKISLGKLTVKNGFLNLLDDINNHGFDILPIEFMHTVALTSMSFLHRDPFDRLLIAQSIVENFPIVTNEEIFERYNIKTLW